MKHFLYLSLLLSLISCGSSGQEEKQQSERTAPSEQSAKQDTQTRPQEQQETVDSSSVQDQDCFEEQSAKIYGIERKGRFRLYTHIESQETPTYDVYNGLPKIEILNKKNEVIKSYNVIENQGVIKSHDSVTAYPLKRNEFKFQLKNKRRVLEYVNKEQYGIPDPIPFLLMRVEYTYNNGVLWITNSVHATDGFRVYGGKTEIIGLDTLGSEIHRQIVDGWISGFNIDSKNRFYALKTGGLASEAVEFFNPMRIYLIDLDSGIVYSHYQKSGCIRGGGIDYPYLVFSISSSVLCDIQNLIKICAVDFHKNKVHYIQQDIIDKNNNEYISRTGGYIEWKNPDSLKKMYYSRHFKVKTIEK